MQLSCLSVLGCNFGEPTSDSTAAVSLVVVSIGCGLSRASAAASFTGHLRSCSVVLPARCEDVRLSCSWVPSCEFGEPTSDGMAMVALVVVSAGCELAHVSVVALPMGHSYSWLVPSSTHGMLGLIVHSGSFAVADSSTAMWRGSFNYTSLINNTSYLLTFFTHSPSLAKSQSRGGRPPRVLHVPLNVHPFKLHSPARKSEDGGKNQAVARTAG